MKRQLFIFLLLSFLSMQISATHIIGGEIGYKNMGGLVYEITLTLYGDCAGSAFPSLQSAVPEVEIFKNGVQFAVINLNLFGTPMEVTPVCPSEVNNTACVSATATLPGIKRFIFKGDITLNGPANDWSFLFNSSFGGSSGAGRSDAITNITNNTRVALLATLNNMGGPNNSSVFTTIPTPFFCINLPQEFNQGAVDTDGDQLSFSLVPGLDQSLTNTVTYIPPYTFYSPLGTTPGGFFFNTTSGQMSFTPNIIQTSLVVNKVTETRGGVVVGTSMREMNLIVLANCANQPPAPPNSVPSSTVNSFDTITKTITLCNADLNPIFSLSVSDPDGQNINASVSGLPSGSSSNIVGNGTNNVDITINWSISQPLVPGTYTFFVNVQDDGCPLSSKQTYAYSVKLVQPFSNATFVITDETCAPGNDGVIVVNTSSTFGGLSYSLGGSTFQPLNVFNGLTSGVYTVTVKDANNCLQTETTMVSVTAKPIINTVSTAESCEPGNDASITAIASSANGAITSYTLNGGTAQASGVFNNLNAGIYTVVAKDVVGCTNSALITVEGSFVPVITDTKFFDITCYGKRDGKIEVIASPVYSKYSYIILPLGDTNQTGKFKDLSKGNYMIIVTTDKNCKDTSFATIEEPAEITITDIVVTKATCDKDNAKVEVSTNRTSTIIYTLFPSLAINTKGVFIDVAPGNYTVSVRDSNSCATESSFVVEAEPNLFTTSITHSDLPCNGWGTEGEAEVFPSGGVAPYTYLWTTNPSSSYTSKQINNLYYGWYFVTVTDATGCETKDTVLIKPGNCCENISIPNAFTPDANGSNDQWRLLTSSGMAIDKFAVYNRWGEKIWSAYDQRQGWDGKRNGVDVSAGTYFYILQYKCLTDGKNYLRKGEVNVIR